MLGSLVETIPLSQYLSTLFCISICRQCSFRKKKLTCQLPVTASMDLQLCKKVDKRTRALVLGFIQLYFDVELIPLPVICYIILYYFEYCKYQKDWSDRSGFNYTNDYRTITNVKCDYGEHYVENEISCNLICHCRWRFRIEKCTEGKIKFRFDNYVQRDRRCVYYSEFKTLATSDVVAVYLTLKKDKKEIYFCKTSNHDEHEYSLYRGIKTGQNMTYKLAIIFETKQDSVTLVNFKSVIMGSR